WRYRVLGYTLIELLSRPLASIAGDRWAFAMAYYSIDITALAAFLAAMYAWLRRWARREHALMGLLLAAVTMPVVFHQYYYVWSTLSALAYALALMAIQD